MDRGSARLGASDGDTTGGLGNLIKDGVSTNFRAELLTAAVLCVLLALLLDVLLVLAQRLMTPWTRGATT